MEKSDLNTNGIGLGLSNSDLLIKSIGGKLKAKSIRGQGAEFYFVLPIGIDPNAAFRLDTSQINLLAASSDSQRILIVDDDSFNQMTVHLALKKMLTPDCEFFFSDNG